MTLQVGTLSRINIPTPQYRNWFEPAGRRSILRLLNSGYQ
jgi:hypothetical protein